MRALTNSVQSDETLVDSTCQLVGLTHAESHMKGSTAVEAWPQPAQTTVEASSPPNSRCTIEVCVGVGMDSPSCCASALLSAAADGSAASRPAQIDTMRGVLELRCCHGAKGAPSGVGETMMHCVVMMSTLSTT